MTIKLHKKVKIRLMFALMLATLVALGVWQMQRQAWKTEWLTRIDTQMQQPPETLPADIAVPADWEYRNVALAGDFDPNAVFWIKPRTENGKVGAHMLVGFKRTAEGAPPVFVNLGFVPDNLMDKTHAPQVGIVEGVAQIPYQSAFTPDNDPVRGDWYWADIPALAKAAGYTAAAPVIVTVPPLGQGYPSGFAVSANIRNNHLQYALFWFSMAAILLIVFTLSQREKPANPAKTE